MIAPGTTDVGNTPLPVSASSLPLPTGAATEAKQTQPGVDIGDVTVNNASGAAAVNIQDGGNSITVDDGGGSLTVDFAGATLNNGTQVTVTQAATQIIAANSNRKKLIIQCISGNDIRVGATGVTNTTGFLIAVGGTYTFEMPDCPTNAIFALRINNGNAVVLVQEVA